MATTREVRLDDYGDLKQGYFFFLSPLMGRESQSVAIDRHHFESLGYKIEEGLDSPHRIITSFLYFGGGSPSDRSVLRASVACDPVSSCRKKQSFDRVPARIPYLGLSYSAILSDSTIFGIREDVQEALDNAGFRGYQGVLCETERDVREVDFPEYYFIKKNGTKLLRSPYIFPDRIDKCQYCGVGLIYCPQCNCIRYVCTECDGQMIRRSRGPVEPGIIREFLSSQDQILDLKEWNGDDFVGWSTHLFVTKRVLDFLQSRHYGPFMYAPVLVDVQHLNPTQKKWLIESQTLTA